jgi:hypothetical protein
VIRMEAESRLSPEEVVEKAKAFFGPDGLGMEVTEPADCCARFEGGGGHVYVQADLPRSESGKRSGGSRVEIQGREWEYQIRRFLSLI